MTRAERREEWRLRVAAFRASGQSMAAWCAAEGMKLHQLRYWLQRLTPVEAAAATPTTWMPVAVRDGEPLGLPRGVLVRVGQATVEVQSGFDPMLFAEVVRVLRTLC